MFVESHKAIFGVELKCAVVLIGQQYKDKFYFVRWATTLGVIGILVQFIGLLRWTFVVPVLASNFVAGTDMAKEANKVAFQVIHQYGGVILGEHIGQLFTILWTVMISSAFMQLKLFPKWVNGLGIISSFIYLLAQAELFATVIPNFPVLDMAGFIGSTLWIIWLFIIGVKFLKIKM